MTEEFDLWKLKVIFFGDRKIEGFELEKGVKNVSD